MIDTGIDYAEENRRELAAWDRRLAEKAAAAAKKRRPDGTTVGYSVRLEADLVALRAVVTSDPAGRKDR